MNQIDIESSHDLGSSRPIKDLLNKPLFTYTSHINIHQTSLSKHQYKHPHPDLQTPHDSHTHPTPTQSILWEANTFPYDRIHPNRPMNPLHILSKSKRLVQFSLFTYEPT